MTRFEVVDGRLWHCGQMARRMRPAQRAGLLAAGADPHKELRARFLASHVRRAWLVDGDLAALGGVSGQALSKQSFAWLTLSEVHCRHALTIIKTLRRSLDNLVTGSQELVTTIMLDDPVALQMAAFLGFHVDHDSEGSPARTRAERRRLIAHLRGNEASHISVGGTRFVAMGYHRVDG